MEKKLALRLVHGGESFSYLYHQYSLDGAYKHSLLICGCVKIKDGKITADIDKVIFGQEDIKEVLEINGGMTLIDIAADKYVKSAFRITAASINSHLKMICSNLGNTISKKFIKPLKVVA